MDSTLIGILRLSRTGHTTLITLGCVCMCGVFVMCVCFDNFVVIFIICVHVFTVFVYFFNIYLYLLVTSVRTKCHRVKTQLK